MRCTTNGAMKFTSSLIAGVAMAGFAMHGQTANFNQDPEARYYAITDLGIVGGPPGQPFHVTNNGLVSGSSAETVKGVPTEHGMALVPGIQAIYRHAGVGWKEQRAVFGEPAG